MTHTLLYINRCAHCLRVQTSILSQVFPISLYLSLSFPSQRSFYSFVTCLHSYLGAFIYWWDAHIIFERTFHRYGESICIYNSMAILFPLWIFHCILWTECRLIGEPNRSNFFHSQNTRLCITGLSFLLLKKLNKSASNELFDGLKNCFLLD